MVLDTLCYHSLRTRMDDQAPSDQQATSDQDFIAITDTVTIPANMTSASVSVTIRHVSIPIGRVIPMCVYS